MQEKPTQNRLNSQRQTRSSDFFRYLTFGVLLFLISSVLLQLEPVGIFVNSLLDGRSAQLSASWPEMPYETNCSSDIALHSEGSDIIINFSLDMYANSFWKWALGGQKVMPLIIDMPMVLLTSSDGPTSYWCFSGTYGKVGIQLSQPSFIRDITIVYLASQNGASLPKKFAPHNMQLWGFIPDLEYFRQIHKSGLSSFLSQDISQPESATSLLMAHFAYDQCYESQTFHIPPRIQRLRIPIERVVLMMENNWGEKDFSCFYRIRIHGC